MIGIKIKQPKGLFFDTKKVIDATTRAERKVLSGFGAFVRRSAKSSIRPAPALKLAEMTTEQRAAFKRATAIAKRKGQPRPKRPRTSEPSRPGTPPYSRTGLLKRFIFFAFDPGRHSVVIGPARLGQKMGDAPAALECGGRSRVIRRRGKERQVCTVIIRARPFMGPAFEKEKPKLPAMWRDSVRA